MSRLASVFVLTASIAGVTACTLDPGTESSVGSTEQGSATEATSPATGEEFAFGTVDSATNSVVPASTFPCRKVTASSIPVFTTATGSTVRCTFFAGDIFEYQIAGSPPLRFETWCPRHTPLSQGVVSWAQGTGTVAITCPAGFP